MAEKTSRDIERVIISLIKQGCSYREVGKELKICHTTVRRICQRNDVKSKYIKNDSFISRIFGIFR